MSERLTIRLDAELRQRLTRVAARYHVTASEFLRYSVHYTLAELARRDAAHSTLRQQGPLRTRTGRV